MGIALLAISGFCVSCDDDTASIGSSLMPGGDAMLVSEGAYNVLTRSVRVDSVYANTNACYLGRIVDPETNSVTTCDFLAQFNLLDNFSLPKYDAMMHDASGQVVADSCQLRVFVSSYQGDSLAPMKMLVQELDTSRVMEENVKYYSNINPQDYVNPNGEIRKTLMYTVRDLSLADSILNSSSYYTNIKVKLPDSYGSYLLNTYYEHPEFYTNSYEFLHHVCPGFYFKTEGGVGVLVEVDVSTLDLFFRYKTKKSSESTENDTIVDGFVRLGATEEVLQNTSVSSTGLNDLASDANCTYLKTPSGILTEVTLPIDEIVGGEHYNDTINNASFSLARMNNLGDNEFSLSAPTNVLLVRKKDYYGFFENEELPDSKTSFITSFSSSTNAYTFSNISRLITICKNQRDQDAGVTPSDTEAEREAKYASWEQENPDWNKFYIVPVKAEYSTVTTGVGTSSQKLLRVRNEMGLYSTRLIRGDEDGKIQISVIYSKFAK